MTLINLPTVALGDGSVSIHCWLSGLAISNAFAPYCANLANPGLQFARIQMREVPVTVFWVNEVQHWTMTLFSFPKSNSLRRAVVIRITTQNRTRQTDTVAESYTTLARLHAIHHSVTITICWRMNAIADRCSDKYPTIWSEPLAKCASASVLHARCCIFRHN